MNQSECTVCPGKCRSENHSSMPYRIEIREEEKERTDCDLLMRYEEAKHQSSVVRNEVDKLRPKVEDLQAKLCEMICEAQLILARLDKIALKPNPFTELDFINLLIESEKPEGKSRYREHLQEARKLVIKGEDLAYASLLLTDAVWRAKQNMKKHFRSFYNPQFEHVQPTLTQKAHTKQKWWPFYFDKDPVL